MHQMGKSAVAAQFDHLGIDHQHPHFVRPFGHQQRADDGVQAHALARPGAAGDQQVRQRGQVDGQRIAGDVFAQEQGHFHLLGFAVALFDHLAQSYHLAHFVGHFDADRVLAGDGGHDAHAGDAQGNRQVVGQPGDLGQPQTGFQLDLVLRNDGPGLDLDDFDGEAEIRERPFENLGFATDLLDLFVEADVLRFDQQVDIRQLVLPRILVAGFVQLRHHFVPLRSDQSDVSCGNAGGRAPRGASCARVP